MTEYVIRKSKIVHLVLEKRKRECDWQNVLDFAFPNIFQLLENNFIFFCFIVLKFSRTVRSSQRKSRYWQHQEKHMRYNLRSYIDIRYEILMTRGKHVLQGKSEEYGQYRRTLHILSTCLSLRRGNFLKNLFYFLIYMSKQFNLISVKKKEIK